MPWLHHVFLHFPIALSAAAALFIVISWVRRRDESWQAASRLMTYLAAAAGVLTITTGLASAAHFVDDGGDAGRVSVHRSLALTASALLLLAAALRWRGARAHQSGVACVGSAVTLVAAAAVSLAAHFGGELLHPGLAPWAKAPHRHGQGARRGVAIHDNGEAPHGHDTPLDGSMAASSGTALQTGNVDATSEGDRDGGTHVPLDAALRPDTAAPRAHGHHPH